jgi:putative ABC transport system permease protein
VPIGLSLAPRSGMTDRGSSMGGMHVVARLKPGVSLEQADSEMARLGTQLAREYPATNGGKSAMAQQLQDVMSEEVRQSLWVLLGAVGFILLIACVNVANLLLVRAADRQKEITLRLALGARRGRIIRQLLSESLLIAMLGGVAGLLLGRWLLDGLLALAPRDIPQLSRVSLDSSVLFFTLGVTVLTGMMCGLLPALYASRTDLHAGLKQGGRSTSSSSREWIGKTLLIAEVSLALVLLAGAGLLVRSMVNLLHVDPGFKTDHLLTMRLNLRGENYNDPRRRVFYEECLARITALPGVRSAAFTIALPIDGSYWDSAFIAADKTVPALADMPGGSLIPVSADYLETMGIRLLNGRWFTSADTTNSALVAVINEKLARRLWPGENPIGKRLRHGRPENQTPWREVVGVVADVKLNGIERDAPLEMYMPLLQEPQNSLGLAVRTSGDPLAAVTAVERAIHSLDKDLPLFSIRSMDQLLGGSLTQRWLTLVLLAGFALLALLLAAIGIYGVIAYSVRQRTHEIGVRIALGAQAGDVLHLVLKQGMRLALMGTVIGLAGALALTRLMMPLLFNVKPIDPLTFAAITAMLALTALMACWIPARRATKVNPITALRFE